jgi:serine/threonine protein kinase
LDSRLGLPVNTTLDGSYRITRVVGSGGFGITYEAEDINLATQVAVKEYYPFDFGDRDSTMSVRPKSERHRQTFDWGRSNFLQEARTLARFEHPAIVRVTRVFEANSTAYMVMRFESGQSFETWLSELGRPPTQDELDAIVAPLLDALQMMHSADFLHRDIAPDNIIVRADGTPVLLDFGAARRAVAEMSRTMTGIVKAGYSPHEQYSSDSRLQGPWSDLYAFGGTLYRAVTGHPPEEATLRVDEDHMPPAVQAAWKGQYRHGFLVGIDNCLKVRHAERPSSVAKLRPMLLTKGSVSKPRLERLVEAFKSPSKPQQAKPTGRGPQTGRTRRSGAAGRAAPVKTASSLRWPAIAAGIVAVIGGAYGGYQYTQWQPDADVRLKTAIEAQRQAEADIAKKKIEEQAAAKARADAESKRLADAENARQEAERLTQAAVAKRKADEDAAAKARADAEAKRVADAAAAKRKADEEAAAKARADAEAKRVADAAAAAKRKADEDAAAAKARADAEAKRVAEAEARRQQETRVAEERARQEAERKRVAEEAAAARARADAEAKRVADARAAEERARLDAEEKRQAEADAARQRAEEDRVAMIDARRRADTEAEERRVAATTLNADERATFVRRVQEVLKVSHCYEGAVNGSSSEAQKGLDRFVDSARKKGKDRPVRIELAKATASDFDDWLREADSVKSDLCVAPRPRPAVVQKEPRPQPQREARPQRSYSPSRERYGCYGGGGGGGGGPIQGVR